MYEYWHYIQIFNVMFPLKTRSRTSLGAVCMLTVPTQLPELREILVLQTEAKQIQHGVATRSFTVGSNPKCALL